VIRDWEIPKTLWRWRARNSDIQQWIIAPSDEVLPYLEDVRAFSALPDKIQTYLRAHKAELETRAAFKRGDCAWWQYTWPLHHDLYSRSRILCPFLAASNRFALDTTGRYLGLTDTTVIFDSGQPEDIRYVLALLNSEVLAWRFRFIGKLKGGGIREYFWNSVSRMPFPRLDLLEARQKRVHDLVVDQVQKIMELRQQLDGSSTAGRNAINRTVTTLEGAVENAIAGIFGLTDQERTRIKLPLGGGLAVKQR
jgi:hypothetical protein